MRRSLPQHATPGNRAPQRFRSLLWLGALALPLAAGCSPGPDEAITEPDDSGPGPTVIVTEARELELRREIEALGTSAARNAVDVTARATNIVAAIRFREGAEVAAGDVLVEFERDEAEANLALAEATLRESQSRYDRSEALAASGTVSDFQIDELIARREGDEAAVRAARARLDATVIRAPFDGRTGLRRISVGGLVAPGDVITTLDDLSTIVVDFAIPESTLGAVRTGMEVRAGSAAYPSTSFPGRVASIDSRVDEITRTITVRASIPNAERRLRPGMFMEVTLLGEPRPAIVIPEQAIVPIGERHYVFRLEEGRTYRREVELGTRRPGSVEILTGIAQGDIVVVEGTQKVADAREVNPVRSTDYAGLEP